MPADVFLTRGHSFLSRAIRFFTRGLGESRTKVNHVGVVVTKGSLETAEVVEAVSRVKRHRLWNAYGPLSVLLKSEGMNAVFDQDSQGKEKLPPRGA